MTVFNGQESYNKEAGHHRKNISEKKLSWIIEDSLHHLGLIKKKGSLMAKGMFSGFIVYDPPEQVNVSWYRYVIAALEKLHDEVHAQLGELAQARKNEWSVNSASFIILVVLLLNTYRA